ncbi:MAG: T9SS type A sorting domain-containing protein, partial [Chitinophagales bacterium]
NLFSVFPNPTSGQISIRYSGNHFPALLEIYNTIGQKVYSTEIASMLTELNTSNFKSGPYFFTFILNGEIISSSLIYVNHEKY